MNFIGRLLRDMERSSAGSENTAQRVLSMCGAISPKTALFVGDDAFTPKLIRERTGCAVTAAFHDEARTQQAACAGIEAQTVGLFELPALDGGYDLLWYNSVVEYDGVPQRIEQLRTHCAWGGTAVFRALCWLAEPSPDTVPFCEHRFGIIEPLDRIIVYARENGFRVEDFYIAPKTDWTDNYYKPLSAALLQYTGTHPDDSEAGACRGELSRETEMFALHCEEYSYVYYIMKG